MRRDPGRGGGEGLDLQISGAGLVNVVFTKWLRPTYTGKKYAVFAFDALNLRRAPASSGGTVILFGLSQHLRKG